MTYDGFAPLIDDSDLPLYGENIARMLPASGFVRGGVLAKALAADEKTRNQLAGQIAEAEFLAQALPIIEEKVRRLTLRQKSVQEKMMLQDSHKTGSE